MDWPNRTDRLDRADGYHWLDRLDGLDRAYRLDGCNRLDRLDGLDRTGRRNRHNRNDGTNGSPLFWKYSSDGYLFSFSPSVCTCGDICDDTV